jgi:hypothetical protein
VVQHEAVQLRLGQLERAGLFDGILGGNHQKRHRQFERLAADRHFAFLHRFEHGALRLGGGAIDLVGQQQVGEDRPLLHAELARFLVQNLRTDDVGRQQIDRELDPRELQIHGLGHGVDQQRLGQARHALQHQVAAGEQRDQDAFHHGVLADDHFGHAAADVVAEAIGPVQRR